MFKLGDYNIDEILQTIAETRSRDRILYTLTQLQKATIDISAESSDVSDKNGNVIRKKWKNKSGTFSATNALLNINIQNAASGNDLEVASTSNPIQMPKIDIYKAGTTGITLSSPKTGSVKVAPLYNNGASDSGSYAMAASADAVDATHFYVSESGALTLPDVSAVEDAPTQFLVRYERDATSGYAIKNTANKFPKSVCLVSKASYEDLCTGELRPCYIVLPSFQVSPEISISLDADNTEMEYNGDIQVDYCSDDKLLYAMYFPDETEENNE